jgi:hypothetical protein
VHSREPGLEPYSFATLYRNVRVTPFNEFESARSDLERYPHLSGAYCYSTDSPHIEGGKDSKRLM